MKINIYNQPLLFVPFAHALRQLESRVSCKKIINQVTPDHIRTDHWAETHNSSSENSEVMLQRYFSSD